MMEGSETDGRHLSPAPPPSSSAMVVDEGEGEGFSLPAGRMDFHPGLEALNWTLCAMLNATQLAAINATDECEDMMGSQLPTALMTIIQLFYALVCVVGLCGNTLVIYVVLRYSKMQTVTNLYILNLALADECFLVGIPFLIVTMAKRDWIFGMAMCKIYLTTTSINQFTSSIFLTVMSADRYVAVCHPISSPRFRTNVIARVVSLTAWATSALLMVPVFMYAATITKESGGENCNIFWPFAEDEDDELSGDPRGHSVLNGQTAFTFYSFVLGFAVPLGLILVFYTLVIFKLKTVGPKNKSKEKKKSHRKVTRLVLTVITVYILCWLPYWITQLALIFTPPGHKQDNVMVAVMLLAGCLSYSNSAMNPVLYAFLSENFKKSFLKACTCATGRDANAVLHVENSAFPRKRTLLGAASTFRRFKERRRDRGGGGGGGDGDEGGDRGHHHGGGGDHADRGQRHQTKNRNGIGATTAVAVDYHGDDRRGEGRGLLSAGAAGGGNSSFDLPSTTSRSQETQGGLSSTTTGGGGTTCTGLTSRASSRSYCVDGHSSSQGGATTASEAEIQRCSPKPEVRANTINGNLAPPQMV